MTMLYLFAGIVLLYFGAEWLVKGAAVLASRLGVSSLVIGLTVVAFGTSAPEMTVSTQAAFEGLGDIAVTNVIGSNSFNIALILGITSLIYPIHVTKQLIRWDVPVMIVVSILCVLCLWDRHLSRLEGAAFFAGIVCYAVWTFWVAKTQPQQEMFAEESLGTEPPKLRGWKVFGLILVGLVFLVLGSKSLIAGSLRLARNYGVSETLIGLTIVSAGTSLPELATSVVAAIRKQPDIAIGNVVGSNIFNILGILGLSSLLVPYSSPGLTGVDLAMMLGMAMISLPFMWTGFVLSRLEGAVYLLFYGIYLFYLWPR